MNKITKENIQKEAKNIFPTLTEEELETLTSYIKTRETTLLNKVLSWIQRPSHNVSKDMDSYNTYVITDKDIEAFIEEIQNWNV